MKKALNNNYLYYFYDFENISTLNTTCKQILYYMIPCKLKYFINLLINLLIRIQILFLFSILISSRCYGYFDKFNSY